MANPIFRITGSDETAAAWASVQKNASASIGNINKLLPGLGAALSAAGLVHFAKQALDGAEQLNKLNERTGIAVEELSALKFAGEQADVGIESLALGYKKMGVNAFEAAEASSEAGRLWKSMGVDAVDPLTGKMRAGRDILLDWADKFAGMTAGIGKSTLAVKVFGKAGDELIPFLNKGRAGISALMIEAERLGLVMDKETAEAAERANDNLKALASTSQALGVALVNQTAPGMARITTAMREALKESGLLTSLWVGMGGVLAESLGLGMKDAAEKAKALTVEIGQLSIKQNEALERLKKFPDGAIEKKTAAYLEGLLAKKKAELGVLQAEVTAERQKNEQAEQIRAGIEQREKDLKAKDAFINALKREAAALGESKEAQMALAAAQEAGKIKTENIAAALLREAAAWAVKIVAMQRAKAEQAAALKLDAEETAGRDKARAAVFDEVEALRLEAAAWNQSGEERKRVALLAALARNGITAESDGYRYLEAQINAAIGRLEYFNELREKKTAREGALKTIEAEIAAIRFETATLRLNNDQKERAVALRALFAAGVNIDNPQGAEQMDAFDAAQQARREERTRIEQEQRKRDLDQRTAQLIESLRTDEEMEMASFSARNEMLAQNWAAGNMSELQYQTQRERLQHAHLVRMASIDKSGTMARQLMVKQAMKGDLTSMGQLFGEAEGLMMAKSRKLFEIGKAAAYAQTIVNTAAAIMSALKIEPFPVGLALAGVAAAKGAIQLQAISSASFGGGGGGTPTFDANPSTGLPSDFGSPTGAAPPPSPISAAQGMQRKDIRVHISGLESLPEMVSTKWLKESVIPGLVEAFGDGAQAVFD